MRDLRSKRDDKSKWRQYEREKRRTRYLRRTAAAEARIKRRYEYQGDEREVSP